MPADASCRIDAVLKIIGDRWTLGIIHALSAGPRRTLDLFSSFDGLSTKTMTERLKRLQRNGLVVRTSYPESPPRVEYSLTKKGSEILPLVDQLAQIYGILYDGPNETCESDCRFCEALTATAFSASNDKRRPAEEQRGGAEQVLNGNAPWGNRRRKRADVTLL
jgi:DNA-binding HxlR family transcriptional regulator